MKWDKFWAKRKFLNVDEKLFFNCTSGNNLCNYFFFFVRLFQNEQLALKTLEEKESLKNRKKTYDLHNSFNKQLFARVFLFFYIVCLLVKTTSLIAILLIYYIFLCFFLLLLISDTHMYMAAKVDSHIQKNTIGSNKYSVSLHSISSCWLITLYVDSR